MLINGYDITTKNIASFLRGNTNYLLNKLKPYQKEQVTLRSIICNDCTENKQCLGECKCITPNMYYDPLKEDSRAKWGRMMDKETWDTWKEEVKNEHNSLEEFAQLYSNYYKMKKQEEIIITEVVEEIPSPEMSTTDNINPPNDNVKYFHGIEHLTVKDLGETRHLEPSTVEFSIPNTLGEELEIKDIVTSCGCTEVKEQSNIIPENDNILLTVEYDNKTIGEFKKHISIMFKTPWIMPLNLMIKGTTTNL